jgi:hypothetical protein
MVTALGWERRRNYEALFSALETLGRFRNVDDFNVSDALRAAQSASNYCEYLQPACSEYFEGLFQRSPKAWSIGYAIQMQAGVIDQFGEPANPLNALSPAAAIERAQGLWKVLGHTGAVAFSRTGDPATGDFHDATVLRKFGDVPDDLSAL